jgi:hypothetical protein
MEKNPIIELVNNLRDDYIVDVINELHQADQTGVFSEASKFRELVQQICHITGGSFSTDMMSAMVLVFKEYAYRNLKLK